MARKDHIAAAVLAAGMGTRMGSDLPKALLTLGDCTVVERVIGSVTAAGIDRIVVVIGHRGELVQQAIGNHVHYALQGCPKGTADALRCAHEALRDFEGYLLTLYCDVPFVPPGLLHRLLDECAVGDTAAALVTVELDNPGHYGRIIRSQHGQVVGIKEAGCATPEELAIREINAGIYCFRAPLIFNITAQIQPNPVRGEYYLTDAIGLLSARGHRIACVQVEDPGVVMGINTPAEWEAARRFLEQGGG